MIAISGCLGGELCRYDGVYAGIPELEELVRIGQAVMFCPEVMGGLSTPRSPAEIQYGDGYAVLNGTSRILNAIGKDVTEEYINGAKIAYQKLMKYGVTQVVMKEKSPSCGSHLIYDGTFSGVRKQGIGVAAAYFRKMGLEVLSEEEWLEKKRLSKG
ncbi:MAG: DUF523 domain-containing protein [Lactobacillales bacterium]|jgi:uncharacterized protein YbbK (DUF523 family)|nr:DUF523 domain-containing protein [Lactobacillales bacterium]